VQSGLIVGRRETVEKIRKHPLYRALRVDKLIYAALETTLEAFRRENFLEEIPVLKMLSATHAELMKRTAGFADRLHASLSENSALKFEIIEGASVIGGGSAPDAAPVTALLTLQHAQNSVSKLEETLRTSNPPVVARILDDKVLIDLRTVSESEESELLTILTNLK
jgi:L-seryl-tRNA(Ser) seleniumtransferase